MTTWVDFTLYAALSAVLWFAVPLMSRRFALMLLADRNPDWVAAHPNAAVSLAAPRWYTSSCSAWGLVTVGVLLAFQLDYWPGGLSPSAVNTARWEVLATLNSALIAIGLIGVYAGAAVLMCRVRAEVPLAARRQAVLERRTLAGHVPPWWRLLTYAILGVHWTAWLVVGIRGLPTQPGFWARAAAPIVFAAIGGLFVRYFINRRPHALDRILGPAHRRSEVRAAFVFIIFSQLMLALQLYQDVAGRTLANANRISGLLLVVLVITGCLNFARTTRRLPPPLPPRGGKWAAAPAT